MLWIFGPVLAAGAAAGRALRRLKARNAQSAALLHVKAAQAQAEAAAAASPVFGGAAVAPQPEPAQPTFRAAVEPVRQVLTGFEAVIAEEERAAGHKAPSLTPALDKTREALRDVPLPAGPVSIFTLVNASMGQQAPVASPPPAPPPAPPPEVSQGVVKALPSIASVVTAVLSQTRPPPTFTQSTPVRQDPSGSFESFSPSGKGRADVEL